MKDDYAGGPPPAPQEERQRRRPGAPAYLNNASASPMPAAAIRAVSDFLAEYSAMGPDSEAASDYVKKTVASARSAVAGIIGCRPDEIVLTQSTTDGVNAVARGIRPGPQAGIVIRGGAHEHHANYYPWLRLAGCGARITSLPVDKDGLFRMADLREAIGGSAGGGASPPPALVSLSHALYNTGAILPVEEVGELLASRGIPYFVDAAQTVGCLGPMDVRRIGCDFMAFNGSKWLRGPMGTGLLYCRRGSERLLEPLGIGGESADLLDGGRLEYKAMPERLETGFRNYPGAAGLDSAARHMVRQGLDGIRRRAARLAGLLRGELGRMPGVTVYGPDEEGARTSIVPFAVDGRDPGEVAARLERQGIIVAVREFVDKRVVRASPHHFNTDEQVLAAAGAVRAL